MTDSLHYLIARLEALRSLIQSATQITADPLDLSADWHTGHAERLASYHTTRDKLREETSSQSPLAALSTRHKLNPLEEDIFLLALAPDLDKSFGRRLASLRRTLGNTRPDLDLILSLLTADLQTKLKSLALLAPDSALRRGGLVQLRGKRGEDSLLGLQLSIPTRVQRALLGDISTSSQTNAAARIKEPTTPLSDVMMPTEDQERLTSLLEAWPKLRSLRAQDAGVALLLMTGPSGTGKTTCAEAIAHHLGKPLLMVDAVALSSRLGDSAQALRELCIEAKLSDAILCFDDGELLFGSRLQGNRGLPAMMEVLDQWRGLVLLTTSIEGMMDPAVMRRVLLRVALGFPSASQRETLWTRALPQGWSTDEDLDIGFVAQKYEFTGAQIKAAAAMACASALARTNEGEDNITLQATDIELAARSQLRHHLSQLAVRTVTHLTMDDIILPEDLKRTLNSVLAAVRNRRRILEDWGFGERMTTGLGLTMLFRGESGTGKTLSAEILASELVMPLYRIAISRIVSKYIGETEKNLEKAFREAQVAGAVLLFDEADAIFTKRVEVSSATDRYSNMEVNLLLQELERFEGVVILTTNLDTAIDDAFDRRLNYKLDFPFPTPTDRTRIWTRLLPSQAPVDLDQDHLNYLGDRFELSGGSIKNVILRSAYAAAEAQVPIGIDLVEEAAIQEYRELGKLIGGL